MLQQGHGHRRVVTHCTHEIQKQAAALCTLGTYLALERAQCTIWYEYNITSVPSMWPPFSRSASREWPQAASSSMCGLETYTEITKRATVFRYAGTLRLVA